MADIPTAEDQNLQTYPSNQLEVDGLGLMEDLNSAWTGPSDCSPPDDHDLFLLLSPPCTPGLAPKIDSYPTVSDYHASRAHWHEEAAKFHHKQVAYLLEQSSELFDLTSPEEQPSLNSTCETMSSPGDHQIKDKQSRSSRISGHGAIQKRQPALPAHVSRALLSQPGLQQFARVTDTSEIPTRTFTRLNFEPPSVYTRLEARPAPWGFNDRFTYNDYGELAPGDRFTVEEMNTFLFQNPRELTLFIQRNPSDSRARYAHPASSRCRFLECVAANYLIGQGQNRVCFAEALGENLDPFHSAGFVHLYCLERFLDFPMICSKLNVRVEDRQFPLEPQGKNRMKLFSKLEFEEAQGFVERCKKNLVSRKYPRCGSPDWNYKGTLCNRLCIRKVEAEPPKVKQARKERGDRKSTIGQHLGDLEMETEHRQRLRRKAALKGLPPHSANHGQEEGVHDDDVDDGMRELFEE